MNANSTNTHDPHREPTDWGGSGASASMGRSHASRSGVRRAAGVACVVVLVGTAVVSLRSGIFARPVSAELEGTGVVAGAGDDGFIDVPQEARTVQAAVDAATEGVTVRLAAGTFAGPLRLGARSVTITGAGASRTTISGGGTGPVAVVDAGSGTRVHLSDLALAGGSGINGAGLLVNAGSVDCRGVLFRDNQESGAIVMGAGRPVFAECQFHGNRSGASGGALCNRGGVVLMVNCAFDANSARTFGGAVYSEGGSVETLGCTFTDNFTVSGAFGGAMYGGDAKLSVSRSQFTGNESRTSGGALYLRGGTAEITGCTFVGNRAEEAWALYSSGAGVRMTGTTLCGSADKLVGGDLGKGGGNRFDTGCFADCNGNGLDDALEIRRGWARDLDGNGVPDDCDLDCNGNGIPDAYEIATGAQQDLNHNGIPDICEIRMGFSQDSNHDLIPDEVEAERAAAKRADPPRGEPRTDSRAEPRREPRVR